MTSATGSLRKEYQPLHKLLRLRRRVSLKARMDHDESSVSRLLPPARSSMWGWLLAIGALAVFSVLADCQNDVCALTQFDTQLAVCLHEHARTNPLPVAILTTLTALGSQKVLTCVALAVALLLIWRRQRVLARVWGIVFAGALLNGVLKAFFQRQRPEFQNPFVIETSWSFPSGHAMGSLIGYGLLAYLLWLAIPRLRLAIVLGTALLVAAIGFSRLYLGAHYFSDVVAGYAAGIVWLSSSISGIETLQQRGWLRLFKESPRETIPQSQSAMESA